MYHELRLPVNGDPKLGLRNVRSGRGGVKLSAAKEEKAGGYQPSQCGQEDSSRKTGCQHQDPGLCCGLGEGCHGQGGGGVDGCLATLQAL